MLTSDQINELHRLYVSEKWPIRKIERHLNMGWKTIKKYLDTPAQGTATRERRSKLDPFKAVIAECLEKDPRVTAALIFQRIKDLGYSGGHAILQEYVRKVRPLPESKRAFVRMEPFAGERFEVDWAHFESLNYSGDIRKLYAFALIDAHSRMLYVEFTHSQSFERLPAAMCMRFMPCRAWLARSSMTIWPPPLPNTMAPGSFPASLSGLRARLQLLPACLQSSQRLDDKNVHLHSGLFISPGPRFPSVRGPQAGIGARFRYLISHATIARSLPPRAKRNIHGPECVCFSGMVPHP